MVDIAAALGSQGYANALASIWPSLQRRSIAPPPSYDESSRPSCSLLPESSSLATGSASSSSSRSMSQDRSRPWSKAFLSVDSPSSSNHRLSPIRNAAPFDLPATYESSSSLFSSSSSSDPGSSSSSARRVPSSSEFRARGLIPAICETDETPPAPLPPRPPLSSAHVEGTAPAAVSERPRKEKQSWEYVIKSGIAGGIAGCVAKTAIAPLDRVKILFQAQNPEFQKYSGHWLGVFRAAREIVKEQGPMALMKGHSATLLRIFPYAAIKYMAYDKLHFVLMPTRASETSTRLFIAGSTSGVVSVILTYPLELIRVRLAFETKKRKVERGAVRRIIRQIYTEGSTEAPFSGDARKRAGLAVSSATASSSPASAAAAAAASSATSNLSTSAAQAQALAQGATASSPVPPSAPSATAAAANTVLQRFPLMKFYRGFTCTILGMVPYAGTSFLVFGRVKSLTQSFFGLHEDSEHARPPLTIFGGWKPSKTTIDLASGALAGAISQTTAYPFEVIRRRQQVGALVRPGSMVGIIETITWIWKTSGWRGFYVGLSVGYLKIVPMTSISFAVWMGLKRRFDIEERRGKEVE